MIESTVRKIEKIIDVKEAPKILAKVIEWDKATETRETALERAGITEVDPNHSFIVFLQPFRENEHKITVGGLTNSVLSAKM